jgi:hypothetical protein
MISSIYTAQNNGFMSSIWKFTSSFYFAFATCIYLLFIFLVVNNYVLNNYLDFLILKITKGNYNFILNMIIYFFFPIMSINYFLIFKESKYKYLIKEYKKNYNKKSFAWYFMIAFIFMFATLFLKKIG